MVSVCRLSTLAAALSVAALSCGDVSTTRNPEARSEHDVATLHLELTIGEDEGSGSEYQFASIVSLLVTPDGKIWVLDGFGGGTPELKQYDAESRFLRKVGSVGGAPGEFRNPAGLALMADGRVALRDFGLPDRITLYSSDGIVDTTWSLGSPLYRGAGLPVAVDTSGIVWLSFAERPGPNRPPPAFLRLRDGLILDTVPFPPIPDVDSYTPRIVRTLPGGGRSSHGFAVPYQPRGVFAWNPIGTFAVARTDQYRIELLPAPGAITASPSKIFSREVAPIAVSKAERADALKRLIDRMKAVPGGADLKVPEIPTHKPPLKNISFSDDGQLLVYVSMPSRLQDGQWTESEAIDVFHPDGAYRGRLLLPDSFSFGRLMTGFGAFFATRPE